MKICNFSKISLLAILLSCGGYVFTSCQDTEFDAAPVDESNYEVSQDQMGYIANNDGKINSASLEVQAGRPADMTLCVKATKSSGAASDVKLVYDEEVLNSYNQDTENEYLAFPSANVTFEDICHTVARGNRFRLFEVRGNRKYFPHCGKDN